MAEAKIYSNRTMSTRIGFVAYGSLNFETLSGVNRAIYDEFIREKLRIPVLTLRARAQQWYRLLNLIDNAGILRCGRRLPFHSWRSARRAAVEIGNFASAWNLEAVLVTSSIPVAALQPGIQVCIYTDATVASMIDYYPSFSRLVGSSRRQALAVDRAGFRRAGKIFITSDWAARSIVRDYGIASSSVQVLPRPGSMRGCESINDLRELNKKRRSGKAFRILFVGVDWMRKGGDIVYKAVNFLRGRGHDIELDIVGCSVPAKVRASDWVTVVGYLNKANPSEYEEMDQLYRRASVFFVPSRAEAMGIVYSEAASYGVPVVAANTGGVSSAVDDGRTGILLHPDSSWSDYADKVERFIVDDVLFYRMSEAGYKRVFDRINWRNTVGVILHTIEEDARVRSNDVGRGGI